MSEACPLAVDIALIPDAEIAADSVALNRALLRSHPGEIRLSMTPDEEHGLPHISLGMFFVMPEQLDGARARLTALAEKLEQLPLTIDRISSRRNAHGSHTYSFDIKKSNALLDLHRAVMTRFNDWVGRRGSALSFFGGQDRARTSDVDWIHHFADKAAFDNFDPHITLGFGHEGEELGAIPHRRGWAAKLGVYHLGPGCTCRKIIHQIDLSRPAGDDP